MGDMEAPQQMEAKLQRLLALHEQRVLTYKQWEKAFKDYVALEDHADGWEDYQNTVKATTGDFVKISTAVREVEAQLAQTRPDLAALVRSLQELEKSKLQLTAKVQAGKEKATAAERMDDEVDWVWAREEKELTHQLHSLVEDINLIIDSFRVELQDLVSGDE